MKDNFDMFFDKEHMMLRQEVRRFVKQEFPAQWMRELDQDPNITFPFEVRNKLRKLDISGIGIPEEYGGTPLSYRSVFIIYEELAKASLAVPFTAALMGLWGSVSIVRYGTEEQKAFYLPKIANGEIICSVAMTESGSASDLTGNINTTAVESGDDFIIDGEKQFITGADASDYMLVLAKTDPESENKQTRHSILIMDVANTPGIEARPIKKLLVRSMSSNVVSFNNVRVPKSNLIGERGQGFYHLLPLLGGHRLMAVGEAVGLAQAAYDEAMAYAKERKSFGHPIGHYQLTQQKLVDMETEIRAARLLGYHAAWLADMGKSNMLEAMIAQRYSSEITFKTATHAMEIFGGYGFAEEYNMERYFRDSRQYITTPFTNDIAMVQIAGMLGLTGSY